MKCTKPVFASLLWALAQMVSNPMAEGAGSVQANSTSEPAWSVDDVPVAGRELLECVGLIRGTVGTRLP
jgi:hypothetical protein